MRCSSCLFLVSVLSSPLLPGCDEYSCPEAPVLVETSLRPSFSIVADVYSSESSESLTSGEYFVQSWDCADLSWWSPVGATKVIQVLADLDDCDGYEISYTEYYECNSLEGSDAWFRDVDGDGLSGYAGDCFPYDPKLGGDDNLDGVPDCEDADGDGYSIDQGDCDEGNPAVVGIDDDDDGTSDCEDDDGDGLSEDEGDSNDEDPLIQKTSSSLVAALEFAGKEALP